LPIKHYSQLIHSDIDIHFTHEKNTTCKGHLAFATFHLMTIMLAFKSEKKRFLNWILENINVENKGSK